MRDKLSQAFKMLLRRLPPYRRATDELAELEQHLWMVPGHYYSPIPGTEDVRRAQANLATDQRLDVAGVSLRPREQLELMAALPPDARTAGFPDQKTNGRRYFADNSWFPRSDAALAQGMICHLRPKRIVEVGCGFSSCVILDTVECFLHEGVTCTFIDPRRESFRSFASGQDLQKIRFITKPVQDVDLSVFTELQEADILFVDSSHVAKTASDVNHLIFEVLPILATGVAIHFHDVFFPFEYPREWIAERRAWNEAYMLRAFLQYNDAFEILLFADYLRQAHADKLRELCPAVVETPGSSLWLRKVA